MRTTHWQSLLALCSRIKKETAQFLETLTSNNLIPLCVENDFRQCLGLERKTLKPLVNLCVERIIGSKGEERKGFVDAVKNNNTARDLILAQGREGETFIADMAPGDKPVLEGVPLKEEKATGFAENMGLERQDKQQRTGWCQLF